MSSFLLFTQAEALGDANKGYFTTSGRWLASSILLFTQAEALGDANKGHLREVAP